MKKYFLFVITAIVFAFYSCQTEKPWQPLFNGENLDNWDMYLGTPLTGFDDLAEAATTDKVFTVIEENGEKLSALPVKLTGRWPPAIPLPTTTCNWFLSGEPRFTPTVTVDLLYHSFRRISAKHLEHGWLTSNAS
jgi:hypothetical protein